MSIDRPTLPVLRFNGVNPNHHLCHNNGTWFLHYTVYPTPTTKERVRRSLGTKDVAVARERRDSFFQQLMGSQPVAQKSSAAA